MSKAVFDAGLLIHLAEIGALDIVQDLEICYVPEAVWQEVARHQPSALSFPGLSLKRCTAPPPSINLQTLATALSLDSGEIESLSLMEHFPKVWFLTDDAAARLVAEQCHYQVHGTIGLLIRSVRRKRRTPREVLDLLRTLPECSSLHIRPALLEAIIQQVRTEWES